MPEKKSWCKRVKENPWLFSEAVDNLLRPRIGEYVFAPQEKFGLNENNVNIHIHHNIYFHPKTFGLVLAKVVAIENEIEIIPEPSDDDSCVLEYVPDGKLVIKLELVLLPGSVKKTEEDSYFFSDIDDILLFLYDLESDIKSPHDMDFLEVSFLDDDEKQEALKHLQAIKNTVDAVVSDLSGVKDTSDN